MPTLPAKSRNVRTYRIVLQRKSDCFVSGYATGRMDTCKVTQLRHVSPIKSYISRYSLTAMLETGAEGGDSIATGQKLRLSPIVSCEILPASYERTVERFATSPEVRVWLGHSVTVLPEMLQVIAGHRTLFWMDAHLPDIRNPQGTYSDEEVMPLRAGLTTILRHRDCSRDVILIDDLVLFDPARQDADWLAAAQSVAPRWRPDLTLAEITAMFPAHHAESLEVNRDGVLALLPAG